MLNEKFMGFAEAPTSVAGWPDYYILTERASYVYDGQAIFPCKLPKTAQPRPVPSQLLEQRIVEVRSDGETTAVFLENRSLVLMDLAHYLTGQSATPVESIPQVRFLLYPEWREWEDDVLTMEHMPIQQEF